MNKQAIRVVWTIAFVVFVLIIAAIIITQPNGRQASPTPESEANGGERMQTFEAMLLTGQDAIFVDNQPAQERSVLVWFALFANPGYVVIHEDDGGVPGGAIGASMWLLDGAENFRVDVDRPLEEGEIYYAMLHADDGDQVWSEAKDFPVSDGQGNVVVMTFSALEGADPQSTSISL